MPELKRTPLFPIYAEHGAKTIDFGGWELPVQFEGIMKEHEAVRERAGLFDVSHMGEVLIEGEDAKRFLQRLTTNDVERLVPGMAQYSIMCYPNGGTVDDLLVYMLGENRYMTVINANNIGKDLEWMRKHAEGFAVTVADVSDETALLALQGPHAEEILQSATEVDLSGLQPFRFVEGAKVAGVAALISRTGYTGEDGFELYVAADNAAPLWRALLEAGRELGLSPAGLGARDTLRFEARLSLYGQELSPDISPLEAGLGFFVKLDKEDFIGRDALAKQKEQGVPRKLVGIEMIDRGIPRSHYRVYAADGDLIGEVTTGTQSPTLKLNLGLALIDSRRSELGGEVLVDVRGKLLRAKIVKAPFYKKGRNHETRQEERKDG
ncbi:glycine cleavage system aminomethyltransferase GcvT [Paenibacillus thermotolerans]|uniref:glycine cleavage system aminomethyltransferase GcvT n=1 Tax=Paenibacillus thermotolerans TaxID=3027807 RepID=UPI00236863D7|nr:MULTISPECIES: glycine cleavage system aminomethyltransferase GcvT [unclassified Paenibacillus]